MRSSPIAIQLVISKPRATNEVDYAFRKMEGLCLAGEVSEGSASNDDEEWLEMVLVFIKLPHSEPMCCYFLPSICQRARLLLGVGELTQPVELLFSY